MAPSQSKAARRRVAVAGLALALAGGAGGAAAECAVGTVCTAAAPAAAGATAAATTAAEPATGRREGDSGTTAAVAPWATAAARARRGGAPIDEAMKRDISALCGIMTAAADKHGVPHDFFIRLIWKESRFNAGARSPVGAQGIAQFMPGTARLRGLADPFDRVQALDASASFLADMKADFGSWGLAAIGYNGGPNRVEPLVAGTGGLPYETIDYVYSITGRTAEFWAAKERRERKLRAVPQPAPEPDAVGSAGPPEAEEEVAAAEVAALSAEVERSAAGLPEPPPDAAPDPAAAESSAAAPDDDAAAAPAASPPGPLPYAEGDALETRDEAAGASGEGAATALQVAALAASPGRFAAAHEAAAAAPVNAALAARAADAALGLEPLPDGATSVPRAAIVPVPAVRPEHDPGPVNCLELVVALGRSVDTAPPAGGGGGVTPWGAQVAGHPKRAVAMQMYARIKGRLPRDIAAKGPMVVVRRFAARGRMPIHTVQFGAGSRGEAQAMCRRISDSLVPCVVEKNG